MTPQERLDWLRKEWGRLEELAPKLFAEEVPALYRTLDVRAWIANADEGLRREFQLSREHAFYACAEWPNFGDVLARLQWVSKSLEDGTYDPNTKPNSLRTPDSLSPEHPVRSFCDRRAIWKAEIWDKDGRPTLHDLLERKFGKGFGRKGLLSAAMPGKETKPLAIIPEKDSDAEYVEAMNAQAEALAEREAIQQEEMA